MSINKLHNVIFHAFFKNEKAKKAQIRDSKGRFVKNNPYRFYKQEVVVEDKKITVLAQNIQVGKFFKATKK